MTPDQARLFPIRRERPRGRVTIGAERTIRALRDTRRLEPVDEALVALFREAAVQLQTAVFDDETSLYTRGVLIRVCDSVLSHLLARPDADHADAELAALFAGVDDAAHT